MPRGNCTLSNLAARGKRKFELQDSIAGEAERNALRGWEDGGAPKTLRDPTPPNPADAAVA